MVIDSGRHVTGVQYDPWNDQLTVQRHQDLVRASAFDPARGHVDSGSLQYLDRYLRDAYGRLYREHGYKWTSYGVLHGDLTKTVVQGGPAIRVEDSTHVHYSTRRRHTPHVQVQDSTRVQFLRKP